jgi:hypothetical protein
MARSVANTLRMAERKDEMWVLHDVSDHSLNPAQMRPLELVMCKITNPILSKPGFGKLTCKEAESI